MLPFLKKKSDAAAAPALLPWHPNFRNYEKLPDIKVVRTAFFVNGTAIALVVALVTYFGIKEWQLRGLNVQIADWQRQIDRDKKESEQAIAQFKKFQAEEAKINEVDAFLKSKPIVSEIVIRLAQTLPTNVALDSLDLRDNGMVLRLAVRGAPDAALGYATVYLEQLRNDPVFSRFDDFQFTGTPTRNPTTGRMAVEFFLHLKGVKK